MTNTLFETYAEKFERSFREGRGYHLRTIQFAEAKRRPSLIFNVASVAVEYYLIALCAYHGTDPRNHNYSCLIAAAEQVVEFEPWAIASNHWMRFSASVLLKTTITVPPCPKMRSGR